MDLIHNHTSFTSKTIDYMASLLLAFYVHFDDGTWYVSGDGEANVRRNTHQHDKKHLVTPDTAFRNIAESTTDPFVHLACNFNVYSIITESGKLYSWGYNNHYSLGANSSSSTFRWWGPKKPYLNNTSTRMNSVSIGSHCHEHLLPDKLQEMVDTIVIAPSVHIVPLIEKLNITTDASNNFVYFPNKSEDNSEYISDISYALNIGIFKIKNVPSSTPLAVLNSGQTNKISYYGTTEETVNTTSNVVDIYVSSGSSSSPYYTFYTDSGGYNELSGNTLYLNRSYRFNRLNSATSHAFYISDSGYGNTSSTIQLSGDGSATSGITGSQTFTVDFNGLANSATLTFTAPFIQVWLEHSHWLIVMVILHQVLI